MQTLSRSGHRVSPCQPAGVRILLLTARPEGESARRLAGYGACVEVRTARQSALAELVRDRVGFDLFVMDCDGFGGMAAGEQAVAALVAAEARMRVILVSADFDGPAYPMGLRSVVCLPDRASAAEFRRGFDHALRDRPNVTMM